MIPISNSPAGPVSIWRPGSAFDDSPGNPVLSVQNDSPNEDLMQYFRKATIAISPRQAHTWEQCARIAWRALS